MYRKENLPKQTLKGIQAYDAESIENKVARVLSNKEAIKDQAPLIYTDRKDGVQPDYDIRTDKYEYLVEGHNALAKTKRAKRDNIAGAITDIDKKNEALNKDTGGESTQTTESQ